GHTGEVEIQGNATLRARAVGDAYATKDSTWLYESILPRLRIYADAGYEDPADTVEFYFDTTVVLWAEDEEGNRVDDAEIYYLIDDGSGPDISEENRTLYDGDPLVLDETSRVQAVAVHEMYQGVYHLWHYRLREKEAPLHAHSFTTSHVDGALVQGKSAQAEGDEIPFGTSLRLVFESPVFERDASDVAYRI
ncbi:hypothetical protein, partial [Chitinivibrio alkaliphilus]|uniref:hypothetical protein n=1 Tax=Chitinivibrio alkaliphilus TaxID=1505232 RepID=UPI0005527242